MIKLHPIEYSLIFTVAFFAYVTFANSPDAETPQRVCTVKQIASAQLEGWHVLGPLEKCLGQYDESQELISCTEYIPYRTPKDFKVTVRLCKTDTKLIGGKT